jgi:Tfp pilus assembly protein FimT
MFVAALIAVMTAVAVPQVLVTVDRMRATAAARFLAARLGLARALAVNRSASVALRFDATAGGITFTAFIDGNDNGVRTREIDSGIDHQLEPPVRLGELFPTVAIAVDVPDDTLRAVQLSGGSNLLTFTPAGTATAGSLYIRGRDGSQLAVRVLGVTGRTRLQRYDRAHDDWIEIF